MKTLKYLAAARPAIAVSLLGLTLMGCIGYVEPSGRADVLVRSPVVVVDADRSAPDDYVYYPGYQVYYSDHRHQYIYRDGRSWVSRGSPPRVSAEVFHAAPSVRLDFHDSPSAHHTTVIRQYPRGWQPPRGRHGERGNEGGDRH